MGTTGAIVVSSGVAIEGASGDVIIHSMSTDDGEGGSISFTGGSGKVAGSVKISGGDSNADSNGGSFHLVSGSSASSTSGNVLVASASSSSLENATGSVRVSSGNSNNAPSGEVLLQAGSSLNAIGGSVDVEGGRGRAGGLN